MIARQGQEVVFKQALFDKLTQENAPLKRMRFAVHSERFSAEQKSLLDEKLDEDLRAVPAARQGCVSPISLDLLRGSLADAVGIFGNRIDVARSQLRAV